ncbi:MAG: transporter [Pseudomonadota bacterium]
MTEIITHLINVVLPIAACVFVGFALAKLSLPFDRGMIGKLVQNIGYPTLIISHLSGSHVEFAPFVKMLGAAAAMLAAFFVISTLFLLIVRLPFRVFVSPMSLNNVGNIGLPVATLAYGDTGLAYSLAFVVVVLLGIFTYGQWIPQRVFTFRQVVTSPVIYAIVFALTLLATETSLPEPAANAFDILGGLAIPLMLLTLGHSLATLKVGDLGRAMFLALAHLAMALAVAFTMAPLFGFTGTERGIFILMAVMPVSVATYLFVELYAEDWAPQVAGLIMISTLLTVIVLPVVMAFLV